MGTSDEGDLAVAVAQFAPVDDPRANLDSIRALTEKAQARGARLIVFPEYSAFFTPGLGPASVAAGEPLDGPFVTGLAELASQHDVWLVAGMLETAMSDRVHNTVVALDPSGELAAVYRKLHLYDAFGQKESDWVVPGDHTDPPVFELDGITVGLQTCYDVRFPEVTRRLADAGAELVLIPSEWVRGPLKEHHWRTLVTARALENTVYVAAPDQAPPIGAGNSMIVDPMGVELATVGENTEVALAWVSRERLAKVREVNPALRLRRFRVEPN